MSEIVTQPLNSHLKNWSLVLCLTLTNPCIHPFFLFLSLIIFNITKRNSGHDPITLPHSWPAVMASALRAPHSSIQSKLSLTDTAPIKRPCVGSGATTFLQTAAAPHCPSQLHPAFSALVFPATNATCIDWRFCRMLSLKMSSIAVVLVAAAEQTRSTGGISVYLFLFRVWTILSLKRHVWQTVVSK